MAASPLPSLAEIMVANPAQIGEPNTLRIPSHGGDDIFNSRHQLIISLLILISRGRAEKSLGDMEGKGVRILRDVAIFMAF